MDELDKLKQIWDQAFDDENQKPVDHEMIEEIIRRKSTGPVVKLKRSLRIEIGAILVSIPLLIALMFRLPETYFVVNTTILLAVFAGSLIYFFYSLRNVVKIWRNNQQSLRQTIESTILMFRFYRKFYIRLNMVLFPFGLYLGYVIGFGLGSDGRKVSQLILAEYMPMVLAIIVSVVFFGLLMLGFWYFLKFYVRKLYDVHLQKLEIILHELLENENIENTNEL
jgi:hypothetical protein